MACKIVMKPWPGRPGIVLARGMLAGCAAGGLLLGGLLPGATALAGDVRPAAAPAAAHLLSSPAGTPVGRDPVSAGQNPATNGSDTGPGAARPIPASGPGAASRQDSSSAPAGPAPGGAGAAPSRTGTVGDGGSGAGQQARPAPAGQAIQSPPVSVSPPAGESGPGRPAAGSAAGSDSHDSNGHGPNAPPGEQGAAFSSQGAPAAAVDAANRPGPDKPASKPASSRKKQESSRKNANNLLIPLPADESVGRQDVDYTCGIDEKKAGDEVRSLRTSLPAGRFTVTYLSADIMALAVLPVDGRVMVFANVVAGDGAKYVGDRYGWWARGDEVTFSREDRNGVSLSCHVVPAAPSPASPRR